MSDDFPTSDSITYVPSGCLYEEEIEIPCKGPNEKVFYTFSLQRRLRQDDTIIAVRGEADDKTIKLLFVGCDDKSFTVLISGGTLGNKIAIHFFIQTSSEEERTFTASLAVMPDGVIKSKDNYNFVPLPGPQGPAGDYYLKDKNISFIGDGLTTFAEHVVEGNPILYPQYLINDVDQTWWMQLIKKTGATLLTNDAYSGSYLSNHGKGSLQTRFKVIDSKTDICLVLMGANDLINNVALGEFNTPASFLPADNGFDISTILGGLCNAIVNLQRNYPKTKFVWITPIRQFNSFTDSNLRMIPGQQARYASNQFREKINTKYQYYTLIDQSRWQGKVIKAINLYPNMDNRVGNITVSKIINPNSKDMQIQRSTSFQIMTGITSYPLNWYLAPDEYIAIHASSSNQLGGCWSYSSTSNTGNFYYFDPSNNQWLLSDGDLNIGIDDGPSEITTNTIAEKMIEIFEYYGVDYIDSRSLGINSMNQNSYLADGTHLNPDGATLFASFVNYKLYGIF